MTYARQGDARATFRSQKKQAAFGMIPKMNRPISK
jgi:hypothetical protein